MDSLLLKSFREITECNELFEVNITKKIKLKYNIVTMSVPVKVLKRNREQTCGKRFW